MRSQLTTLLRGLSSCNRRVVWPQMRRVAPRPDRIGCGEPFQDADWRAFMSRADSPARGFFHRAMEQCGAGRIDVVRRAETIGGSAAALARSWPRCSKAEGTRAIFPAHASRRRPQPFGRPRADAGDRLWAVRQAGTLRRRARLLERHDDALGAGLSANLPLVSAKTRLFCRQGPGFPGRFEVQPIPVSPRL